MSASYLLLLTALCLLPTGPAAAQTAPAVLSDAPASAAGRRALATADAEIADPVQEARRTLPQARKRFQAGLPAGEQCLVLVRLVEGDTLFRPASLQVIGWRDGRVQALLPAAGSTERIPVSFPEAAVLDWMVLRADGREEGNYVGRYLEVARNLEGMRLR